MPSVGIEMTTNTFDNGLNAKLCIYDDNAVFAALLPHRVSIRIDPDSVLESCETLEWKAGRIATLSDGDFRDNTFAPEGSEWLVSMPKSSLGTL